MGIVLGLAVGYVIGATAGSRDLDQMREALQALRESDEFADVLSAARTHAAHTLRELASMLERGERPAVARGVAGVTRDGGDAGDLVNQVRHLFGRDDAHQVDR